VVPANRDNFVVAELDVSRGSGNLLDCVIDVKGRDRNVASVNNLNCVERCAVQFHVMSWAQMARGLTDGHRTKSSARAVGRAVVEWDAENGDVVGVDVTYCWQSSER
jgi:hypothetical protein